MADSDGGESLWGDVEGCDVSSDGSKSYRDDDGGWGYRDADGNGSYHGADGTWGYWESDGSFSFHGEDGTWAYGESDGTGSYHGNDGTWGYWDADEYSIHFNSGNYESGTVEEHGGFIDFSGKTGYIERDDSRTEDTSFHGYPTDIPSFTIPISVPDETVDKLRAAGEYMGKVAAAKRQIYHYEAKERTHKWCRGPSPLEPQLRASIGVVYGFLGCTML